jgi:hypothetical protein
VLAEIKQQFKHYFDLYLETEAGSKVSGKEIGQLAKKLGCSQTPKNRKMINKGQLFKGIIKEAIDDFEKDRPSYVEKIMDEEMLEEHEEDPPNFKNRTLKVECPIIRMTLQNRRARELDKYRAAFKRADPNELLTVVTRLSTFANNYLEEHYDKETYEDIKSLEELGLADLDEEDYTVFGVIGGGIRSHLLYKFNPSVFPNRGREAVWAFWYLSNKKKFNCEQDSEFLMINLNKNTTQHNYFYPYELFSFYAFNIYKMLKEEAEKLGVYLDPEYRYVFVESYLSFVAQMHSEEIDFLKSDSQEEGYAYQ